VSGGPTHRGVVSGECTPMSYRNASKVAVGCDLCGGTSAPSAISRPPATLRMARPCGRTYWGISAPVTSRPGLMLTKDGAWPLSQPGPAAVNHVTALSRAFTTRLDSVVPLVRGVGHHWCHRMAGGGGDAAVFRWFPAVEGEHHPAGGRGGAAACGRVGPVGHDWQQPDPPGRAVVGAGRAGGDRPAGRRIGNGDEPGAGAGATDGSGIPRRGAQDATARSTRGIPARRITPPGTCRRWPRPAACRRGSRTCCPAAPMT
jgi:hypothetical protein